MQRVWETVEVTAQAIVAITLTPGKRSALNNSPQLVSFRVVDVGDPVAGAKVTVAGDSATTNANGYARVVVSKGTHPGTYKVTATAANNPPGQASLVVTAPPPVKPKSA